LCHATLNQDVALLRQQIVTEVLTKTIDFDSLHRPRSATLDAGLVRETFRRVCRYAGQHVGPKRLAEEIGQVLQAGVTPAKVADALAFLADSLLIQKIQPLELLLKRQANGDKLCVCDNFVRNGFLQETIPIAPDVLAGETEALSGVAGHLVESIIGYYLKGIPGLDIAWCPARKDEPEVDFVLTIGTQRIPVEIKYRKVPPTTDDLAGIESFCGRPHYNAPFGIIVTQTHEGPVGLCAIAVPVASLLLVR
jgi:predicted AAA+ superfamily ATPase